MKKKSLTDVKSKPLKNSSVWQPVCQKQDPASASGIQTRKKHQKHCGSEKGAVERESKPSSSQQSVHHHHYYLIQQPGASLSGTPRKVSKSRQCKLILSRQFVIIWFNSVQFCFQSSCQCQDPENQRRQLMKLLQLKMDVEKPIAFEHMQQYGLVKLRSNGDQDDVKAFNLYPRPFYNGKGSIQHY